VREGGSDNLLSGAQKKKNKEKEKEKKKTKEPFKKRLSGTDCFQTAYVPLPLCLISCSFFESKLSF
jgi:hypothetical protein